MTNERFRKIVLWVTGGLLAIPIIGVLLWIISTVIHVQPWEKFWEETPPPPDTVLIHSGFPISSFDYGSGDYLDWWYYAFLQSELAPEEILDHYKKRCAEADGKFEGDPNYASIYVYRENGWHNDKICIEPGTLNDHEFEREMAEILEAYPNREKIFLVIVCKPGRTGFFN